jgi:hypothetical protein
MVGSLSQRFAAGLIAPFNQHQANPRLAAAHGLPNAAECEDKTTC